jgi:hypothetical protein
MNFIELTTEARVQKLDSFSKMRIIDYPGSKNFVDEILEQKWCLSVEKGGLGIGGPKSNLAVIYVVDAQVKYA